MILLSFCSFPWWLFWLLPFLLGALAMWAWMLKYKTRVGELESDISGLRGKISSLEEDLATCQSRRADAESELALLKGRIREYEAEIASLKVEASSSDAGMGGALGFAGGSSGGSESDSDSGSGSDADESSAASDDDNDDDEGKGLGSGSEEDDGGSDGDESNEEGDESDDSSGMVDIDIDGGDIDSGKAGDDSSSNLSDAAAGMVGGFAAGGSGSGITGSSGSGGTGGTGSGAGSGGSGMYAAIKEDNLQVVEGIGPKMEEVLKDNGIKTHADLGSKSTAEIKAILGRYGEKYTKIIDPSTWSQQASMANQGNWEGLIALQKQLDTGRSGKTKGPTNSKVEKMLIKMGVLKQWKENDLKAVEGIGPKIAGLLNDAGINTWRGLSETSVDRIQGILNAAGARYKLADPSTWPKQSGMAADSRWDELREYQDKLKGGKE